MLTKRAEEDHKDLNTLVQEILQRHITWGAGAGKAGWVPVQKSLLIAMAEHIDEEALCKIATTTALNTDLDFLINQSGKYGPSGIINFLKARADAADFPITTKTQNRSILITMHHRMGMKWSTIFKKFYQTVFADLGIPVRFYLTDSTLIFALDRQQQDPSTVNVQHI